MGDYTSDCSQLIAIRSTAPVSFHPTIVICDIGKYYRLRLSSVFSLTELSTLFKLAGLRANRSTLVHALAFFSRWIGEKL
ncbi:MAG TPA: hypothetical protein VK579_10320 [Terriglobales bacterium]|nr:hypothetical protein [Terriglobales bacterium]